MQAKDYCIRNQHNLSTRLFNTVLLFDIMQSTTLFSIDTTCQYILTQFILQLLLLTKFSLDTRFSCFRSVATN